MLTRTVLSVKMVGMDPENRVRITTYVGPALADDITDFADRWGISLSSATAVLLSAGVATLQWNNKETP